VVANNHLSDVVLPLWKRAADDVLKREAILQQVLTADKEVQLYGALTGALTSTVGLTRRLTHVCVCVCVHQAAGKARAVLVACINAAKIKEEPFVRDGECACARV
jgi:hypothetical protein